MKKASIWVIPITNFMLAHAGVLPAKYDSLEKFVTKLHKMFSLTNTEQMAIVHIKNLCVTWHPFRNTHDVAQYTAEFQTFALRTKMSDKSKKFKYC